MRIVFLGPPGAGKGTQAALLSKKFSIPHVSSGDLLREAVTEKSAIGLKAKGYMDRGELVPDEIITRIIIDRISRGDAKTGFILDGFPRTERQAKTLDESLSKVSLSLDAVIYFETSKNVCVERLAGRRVCGKCGVNYHIKNMPPRKDGICDHCQGELYQRNDDKVDTIENRLTVYSQMTKPLIDYYKNGGLLKEVSGDLELEEAQRDLSDILREAQAA
ncbi:MAG: adenylate kinase [Candidatus Omnitrophota bacterium]